MLNGETMTDTTSKTFGERLSAILDYDDIPEGDRARFLMNKCGLSRDMAKQVLSGKEPTNLKYFEKMASGLDVNLIWLAFTEAQSFNFHPRTCRIIIQQIKGRTKAQTDRVIRLFVAYCVGHRKASNLMGLVEDGQLTVDSAAKLMAA